MMSLYFITLLGSQWGDTRYQKYITATGGEIRDTRKETRVPKAMETPIGEVIARRSILNAVTLIEVQQMNYEGPGKKILQ